MPGSPHPLWERWRRIQLLVVLNSLRCWLELFESLVFGFVWSLWTPFPVVFSHFFFIEVSSKTWKPLRPCPTYQNWRMMQNDEECCVSISHIRVCLMKTMWRVREEYEDLIHQFFSKSHQEEQFPFATSTYFSFFPGHDKPFRHTLSTSSLAAGRCKVSEKASPMCEDDSTSTGASFFDGSISLKRIAKFYLKWGFIHFWQFLSSSSRLRLVYQVVYLRWNPTAEVSIHRGGDGTMTRSESVFASRKRPGRCWKFEMQKKKVLKSLQNFIAFDSSRNKFQFKDDLDDFESSEDFLVETHVPPRPGPLSVKPRMVKPLVRLRRPGRVLSAGLPMMIAGDQLY